MIGPLKNTILFKHDRDREWFLVRMVKGSGVHQVLQILQPSVFDLIQFREFLETYNKITEVCFGKCVQNLNRGALYDDEVCAFHSILASSLKNIFK